MSSARFFSIYHFKLIMYFYVQANVVRGGFRNEGAPSRSIHDGNRRLGFLSDRNPTKGGALLRNIHHHQFFTPAFDFSILITLRISQVFLVERIDSTVGEPMLHLKVRYCCCSQRHAHTMLIEYSSLFFRCRPCASSDPRRRT